MRGATIAVLALMFLTLGPRGARADDKVAAEEAFLRGKALTKEGKLAAACDAFARSQKLDPQFGTQYNLALCYEALGRTASAWGLFRELAQRDTTAARRRDAEKRASKIAPQLARVLITIDGPPIAGVTVSLSGNDVTATIGVATAVDPGDYAVEARADGYATFTSRVTVRDASRTIAVTIPELERAKPARRPADAAPLSPAPRPSAPSPVTAPTAPRTRLGMIVASSGLAVTAGGVVLGVLARARWSDAEEVCGADHACDSAGDLARSRELADEAGTMGNVSTAAIATGAAVLTVGVVLWLTAPPERRERGREALHIAPVVDRDGVYVQIGGAL